MTLARSAAVEADMAVATMVVVRGAKSDTSKQLFLAHPKISMRFDMDAKCSTS
jgi:hypothetical protein